MTTDVTLVKLFSRDLANAEFAQLLASLEADLKKANLSLEAEPFIQKRLAEISQNLPHFQASLTRIKSTSKAVGLANLDKNEI